MNKLSSIVAAVALTVTVSSAVENYYVGGGLALQSADPFDGGIALVINGGMPILPAGDIGPGVIAIEGEFAYSIVAPEKTFRFFGSSVDSEISIMTLAVYAAYIYDINEQFYVKPRAGLIYRSYDADVDNYTGPGYAIANSDSEFGLSFGIGAGYRLSSEFDVYVDYTMIDGSDLTHLTAGVQYHF